MLALALTRGGAGAGFCTCVEDTAADVGALSAEIAAGPLVCRASGGLGTGCARATGCGIGAGADVPHALFVVLTDGTVAPGS